MVKWSSEKAGAKPFDNCDIFQNLVGLTTNLEQISDTNINSATNDFYHYSNRCLLKYKSIIQLTISICLIIETSSTRYLAKLTLYL